jgi:hypothetical protein
MKKYAVASCRRCPHLDESWVLTCSLFDQENSGYSGIVNTHCHNGTMPAWCPLPDDREAELLAACKMVPPLLKQIRGLASDLFGGESSLTDCIDLVLSETETAIAKAGGGEE